MCLINYLINDIFHKYFFYAKKKDYLINSLLYSKATKLIK